MEVNGRSSYIQEGAGGVAAVLIAAADQIAMRADSNGHHEDTCSGTNTNGSTTISLPVEPLEGTVTKAILDETCHQNSANIAEEFRSLSALFEKEGTLSSSKILSHQGRPIGFLSIDTNNKVLALYGTKKFTTLLGRIPKDNGNIFIFQGEKKISSSTSTLLMTSELKWTQRFHLQNYQVPTSQEIEDFYDIHSKDVLMPSTDDASTDQKDSFWLSKMMFCPLKWIPYLFKDNLTPYEALQIIQKLIQRDLKASVQEYADHLLAFLRLACTKSGTNDGTNPASRMQVDWDIPKPDDIICRWAKSLSTTYFDLSKKQQHSRLSSIIPDYSSHLAPGPVYQPKASFSIPDTGNNSPQRKPLPKLKRVFPPTDEDDDKKKKEKKYKTTATKAKNGKASPSTSNMSLAERRKAAASITAMNASNGNKNDKAAALAAAILRGVTMRPSGKWQAQFYYAGKSRYIGVFQTREKAALAYEIVREKLKSDKPWEKGAMSMQEAEDQVSAARKAAFEGVDEKFRVNCTL